MESMVLVGAEQLSSAMYSLRSTAERMQQASASYEYAIQRQQQFMDDWLQRFEAVLNASKG